MKNGFKFFVKTIYLKKVFPIAIAIAFLTWIVMYFMRNLSIVNYLNVLFIEASVVMIIAAIFFTSGRRSLYKYYSASKGTQLWGFETKNEAQDNRQRTSTATIFLLISVTLFIILVFTYVVA